MRKLLAAAGALALLLSGCSAPQMYEGYVHAECDATTADKVTHCRATEKPLPTVTATVTVTPEPTATSTPPSADGTQAAVTQNWGPVIRGDEFNYTGAPDPTKWGVYNSAGHAGNGTRTPTAWNGDGNVMRVTGDANGNTGGMAAKFDWGKTYYKVEVRARTNQRDPEYHPVLILWPDAGWGSTCPEMDFMESMKDPTHMSFNLHYPTCGQGNWHEIQNFDTTQWHNYAVSWTADGIKGYIDGVEWFSDTTAAGKSFNMPMHQTIQLDWFPQDSAATNPQPSWMEVDWTRVYQ